MSMQLSISHNCVTFKDKSTKQHEVVVVVYKSKITTALFYELTEVQL